MKKYALFFVFYILFIPNASAQCCKTHANRIELVYVDPYILTPIDVDCNSFDKFFSEYKTVNIVDTTNINNFFRCFNNLSIDSLSPDVRIKIKTYNKGVIKSFCIGNFTIETDEGVFKLNDEIKKLIVSWVNINDKPIFNNWY